MIWERIKRAICPPPQRTTDELVADADARLSEVIEIGRQQLEETRTIRRDLTAVRRRMERGEFPVTGERGAGGAAT